MKRMMMWMTAGVFLIAGCGQNNEAEIAALQAESRSARAELQTERTRSEHLQDQVTELDGKLRDAQGELDELRLKLEREGSREESGKLEALQGRIDELEAELERSKAAAEQPPADPAQPEANAEPAPDPLVKTRLDELLPLVKTGADRAALGEAVGLLEKADKATRDEYITRLRDWVKQEPENKHARVALALALTSRFQDLKGDMMKQGALAGEIKKETEKALEVDPDYYEAVHFLAILKASYPSFTPEFKDARATLDKALALQADMNWEDRFAEIYAAYGMWHRVQKQYDEAAARVQAGLVQAPRDEGLLAEQQAIEAARNAGKEE